MGPSGHSQWLQISMQTEGGNEAVRLRWQMPPVGREAHRLVGQSQRLGQRDTDIDAESSADAAHPLRQPVWLQLAAGPFGRSLAKGELAPRFYLLRQQEVSGSGTRSRMGEAWVKNVHG